METVRPEQNPYRGPADIRETAPTPDPQMETIRRELIQHEAAIKGIGVLHGLAAPAIACLGLWRIVFAAPPNAAGDVRILAAVGTLVASVAVAFVGYGLISLLDSARGPAVFSALISGCAWVLIRFPAGLVLSALILYLVLSPNGRVVLSDEYHRIIDGTPHVRMTLSPAMRITAVLAVCTGVTWLLWAALM